MRLLWVATKLPWPPTDGGRLLLAWTLRALRDAGHEVTLVAPANRGPHTTGASPEVGEGDVSAVRCVDARPRAWPAAAASALLRGLPSTIARHTLPAVRAAVAAELEAGACDAVVSEQVHALAQCEPAFARGVPVLLRAQNVESDLWRAAAAERALLQPLLNREARRLAAYEAEAVRRAAATLALTARDAERLRAASGVRERVHHVPAPFPGVLPAAGAPLPGVPAVVLLAGRGWRPNALGATWFAGSVWPAVHRALPEARLHVFGDALPAGGVVVPTPQGDSREAFAPGAVLVVPLRVASGVRMKVLEAWARGVPVVATPEAAEGLDCEDGRELLLASTADDFVGALRRLDASPGLAQRLVAAGRKRLRDTHDPARIAARIAALLGAPRG